MQIRRLRMRVFMEPHASELRGLFRLTHGAD
jgi:hypothetical protein